MKRAGISTGPPGAKGTMKRMVRLGQAGCATAGRQSRAVASRARRLAGMDVLRDLVDSIGDVTSFAKPLPRES
ncbi:hypothetical protein GCM10011504_29980 [Siccirubricoccus deserti]|nr:hypothetical protein GCM10011504_29980 [Siccirubricoccus deserti]